jgi:hypothetical protein
MAPFTRRGEIAKRELKSDQQLLGQLEKEGGGATPEFFFRRPA